MNKSLLILVAAVCGCASVRECVSGRPEPRFRIGVAGYTFCEVPLDKALGTMQAIDCNILAHKDFFLPYDADEKAVIAYRHKLAAAGVETYATGPLYAETEAKLRQQFEFAKRLGIKVLVGVPFDFNPKGKDVPPKELRLESDKVLDIVDRLVKEYDMRYAVHNHGPDNACLYPTAEAALKRIGNRDWRIGVCLDIGHERRAGLDPVEFIRKHGDRIYDVHLKNIRIDPVANFAMEGPRGDLDIPAVFRALADVGYDGVCHIEYEKNFEKNEMALAESFGYYRGCLDALKRDRLPPVPEDEEGFVPLFNGRDLTGWEGNGISNYTAEAGCLACVANGRFGGGNLWTVRDYTNFVLRFDFKLPPEANNGLALRAPLNSHASIDGMEIQILDDRAPYYWQELKLNPYQYHGSIYGVVPAKKRPGVTGLDAPAKGTYLKPTGEWNSQEVRAIGSRITVILNGETIVDADLNDYKTDGSTPDHEKHVGLHNASGRLGWCGHGYHVQWRNIRIREL